MRDYMSCHYVIVLRLLLSLVELASCLVLRGCLMGMHSVLLCAAFYGLPFVHFPSASLAYFQQPTTKPEGLFCDVPRTADTLGDV